MQYNKLHLFFTALSVCALLGAQDTDCMGNLNGTSVCLEYTDIDSEFGHLDISYNSLNDIYGFQLNITAITILAVESNVGAAYFTESTGFILGISLDGQPLPAGDGILASIDFVAGPEVESCLGNILISGIGGQSYPTSEYCSTIPSAPTDCMGLIAGEAYLDDCDTCSGGTSDHEANSDIDCNGDCYGSATIDECGTCSGGLTEHVENSDMDCTGLCFGSSYIDNCGTCDYNPANDCVQDCLGEWGGEAVEDECGICEGDGYAANCIDSNDCLNMDCSGTCSGSALYQTYYNDSDGDGLGSGLVGDYCSASTEEGLVSNNEDTDDNCFTNIHDECGICDGDGYAEDCVNTNDCDNMDCTGACGGVLVVDICLECGGNGWDTCDEDNDGIQ